MDPQFITRPELERSFDYLEARLGNDRDEILQAVRDLGGEVSRLRTDMNGQFRAHNSMLSKHDTSIAVIEDRGSRDNTARWGGAVGTIIAVIAGYFSLK